MKSFRQMKKRTFMSMLFLGVSLAVFATTPQVRILWWSLTDITSNSAHLAVETEGVATLIIEVCTPEGDVITSYTLYPGATDPKEIYYYVKDINDLIPNTAYKIKIIAVGLPDRNGQANRDSTEIYFLTDPELL